MVRGLGPQRRKPHDGPKDRKSSQAPTRCLCHLSGDLPMQWQTPTATDFRFGFEITMYVSNR